MQIEAKDIRVGNLVYGVSDRIETIKEIHFKGGIFVDVGKLGSEIRSNVEDISGIPLSPDILVKCGAKQNQYGDEWSYTLNISAIKIKFRFNGSDCYSELGGIYLGDKIKYLHQLQNLYYSLTGHELEINL